MAKRKEYAVLVIAVLCGSPAHAQMHDPSVLKDSTDIRNGIIKMAKSSISLHPSCFLGPNIPFRGRKTLYLHL